MIFKFSLCWFYLKTVYHDTGKGPSMHKCLIHHFFNPINKTNEVISSTSELEKRENT